MASLRVAIYARVSSDQQAGGSIASQIAALEARVLQEGLRLEPDHRFIDDGYSGATLIRPALERLRDTIAAGALDRLYVHSPDRLARRYAYQVLLIDEFCCAALRVSGPASRWPSSTGRWAAQPKTTCCFRFKG
jgi:site-specific DNA recombinase